MAFESENKEEFAAATLNQAYADVRNSYKEPADKDFPPKDAVEMSSGFTSFLGIARDKLMRPERVKGAKLTRLLEIHDDSKRRQTDLIMVSKLDRDNPDAKREVQIGDRHTLPRIMHYLDRARLINGFSAMASRDFIETLNMNAGSLPNKDKEVDVLVSVNNQALRTMVNLYKGFYARDKQGHISRAETIRQVMSIGQSIREELLNLSVDGRKYHPRFINETWMGVEAAFLAYTYFDNIAGVQVDLPQGVTEDRKGGDLIVTDTNKNPPETIYVEVKRDTRVIHNAETQNACQSIPYDVQAQGMAKPNYPETGYAVTSGAARLYRTLLANYVPQLAAEGIISADYIYAMTSLIETVDTANGQEIIAAKNAAKEGRTYVPKHYSGRLFLINPNAFMVK